MVTLRLNMDLANLGLVSWEARLLDKDSLEDKDLSALLRQMKKGLQEFELKVCEPESCVTYKFEEGRLCL